MATILITQGLALAAPVGAAETELVGAQTPWRVFLRMGPYVGRKDGALVGTVGPNRESRPGDFAKAEFLKDWTARHTPAPADGWFRADFDDNTWGRYQADELGERTGGYGGGYEFAPGASHLPDRFHLRTCFGISDPATARDLNLELTYLGGAVVYLNGKEVGRGHLPAGGLDAAAYAEDYPAEAYLAEDGTTFLPRLGRGTSPEPQWKDRYEQRIRRLKLRLPAESLVKGANVLAIEIRRAPTGRTGPYGHSWDHGGFHSARLLSASGEGAVAWTAAVERTYVWNAWPMETVTEKHTQEKPERSPAIRSFFTRGLETGNPFDPLRPVRIAVPRNGNCAGVAVVSDQRGVKGLSAKVSPLAGPGGATLKPDAIEIRYAAHQRAANERPWCDVLLPAPPAEAKNVPVWLLVNPPKDQAPGWYTGTLSLSANGQQFQVPVEVLVTAFAVPAPRENRSMVGMIHSPDTVALQYGVKPWSEKHFALMEKTIAMMGQLGSDVVHVPVTLYTFRGVKTGMIRWVQQGEPGYRRDYSALETFLDLWTKHCGPPKALTIDMYAEEYDPETFEARDGGGKGIIAGKRNEKKRLPKVTLLDPASGDMTEFAAPWIGDPAGEAFWRPVFDEVRAIVRRRGWPDSVIMVGEPRDGRPTLRFVQLMAQWAPYARWSLFSHFSGDGRDLVGATKRTGEDNVQADGRWLALPGLEVGYGAMPHEPLSPAMTQDEGQRKRVGLIGGTSRCNIRQASSAEAYRTHVWWTGNSAHYGMDFWNLPKIGCLHAQLGMLTSNVPLSMTTPGPDGPLPTVRFQMYREAVQEAEAWLTIVGTCVDRKDDQAKAYMALYRDAVKLYARGGGVENSAVPLAKLSLGWSGAIARAYEAAGEVAGAKSAATWQQPPSAEGAVKNW